MGRLTEPMGAVATGFGPVLWYVRAVWTGNDLKFVLVLVHFKHSTGITDSAYTHHYMKLSLDLQQRLELIGINRDELPYDIDSATKTGSDGEKKSGKIQQHQIALMVFMILPV